MSTVPYTFAGQTGNIPLSELDDNFANVKASVDYAVVAGTANTALFATTATSAITANTVSNPFQPYITTLGVLTSLNVSGNITGPRALNLANAVSFTSTSGYGIGIGHGNHLAQGANAIAIGYNAGANIQALNSIAIGTTAGNLFQGANGISVGYGAGLTSQGSAGIAIGVRAGQTSQGTTAISIGVSAGNANQGNGAVAIGSFAANNNQGLNSIAIGSLSGGNSQGRYSVAIGYQAGNSNIGNNTIILNATGIPLDTNATNSFFVAPIRNDNAGGGNILYYKSGSKEIVYSNTFALSGTISATNIITNQISSDDSSYVNVHDGLNVQGNVIAENVSVHGNILAGNLQINGQTLLPSLNLVGTLQAGNANIYAGNISANANIFAGKNLECQGNVLFAEIIPGVNNVQVNSRFSIGGVETVAPNWAPVSNGTAFLSSITSTTMFTANATGYTLTINMPPSPPAVDGQITRFTVLGNAVTLALGTGNASPTFAGLTQPGTGYKYIFRASANTWYRSV
jgi:hypothetical protein